MLRKYKDTDFELLQTWITDADLQFRFSGPDWQFPLTRTVLENYISAHPQRQFYIGVLEEGEPYAFGEIISGDANSPRLGRLLVGKEEQRGKGLGQVFVKELVAECIRIHKPEQIFLFVFEENEMGITCYKKCGFEFCGEEHFLVDTHGRQLKILKMVLDLRRMIDDLGS